MEQKNVVAYAYNQTLEEMAKSWLYRKLRDAVFGKPNRGEPAYDERPRFRSTYPDDWAPDGVQEYNDWIRSVHESNGKKFRNRRGGLSKFEWFR